jgi:hypothetical protein
MRIGVEGNWLETLKIKDISEDLICFQGCLHLGNLGICYYHKPLL